MLSDPQTSIYEFDDFRIDAVKCLLAKTDGKQIRLTPKVFATLLYFVRNSGKVIEKDELMREIWTDTIVEENNLSQNISILRRVLGEKRGEHRFIATIPGQGFKFVADVREIDGANLSASPAVAGNQNGCQFHADRPAKNEEQKTKDKTTNRLPLVSLIVLSILALGSFGIYLWRENEKSVADARIKSIAVLPFKPLVAEHGDEALEIGMADTLIARLGNNQKIIVRPLSSVRRFGNLEQDAVQAGRALDVEAVLDGSIQRWGDGIRVNVRLIRVADGTALWTGTFDEKSTGIFVVQDAISKKVVAALALQLGGDEQKRLTKHSTENIEAYQLYLKGHFLQSKDTPQDAQIAIEYLQQAIALDPNFALAYVGLADAYADFSNFNFEPPREYMPKAREFTLKALSLDDQLPEAHVSLGGNLLDYDYDFIGAEREFKRAIELNPNYADAHLAYGNLLANLGRREESFAELRRGLELDPISLSGNFFYGNSLFLARRYDEAIAQFKKTLELNANYFPPHSGLAFAYEMTGDYAASIAERVKINEVVGAKQRAELIQKSFDEGGWQGFLRAVTDERHPIPFPPNVVAASYAELGEKDKAFAFLNKLYEDRNGTLVMLKVDPRLDSLRDDPRFIELMRRMNFE